MGSALARNRKNRKERKRGLMAATPLKPPRLSLWLRLRNYFLAGVLVTAPISITIWVAWNLLRFVDYRVTPLLPPQWNPETYLPFGVPGLGLVVLIVFLILVGFLTAGLVGRVVMGYAERSLARVPIVRSVYSATKQLFETVLAQKSTAFRQVVLIEYPCRGTWAIGFMTGQTLGEVQDETADVVYNIFVPATPNPTTGFLLFVPERDIHVIDMSVEDGIKLVVSGGIVMPPKKDAAAAMASPPPAEPLPVPPEPVRPEPAAKMKARPLARLRNYLIAGVLVTAPISITIWLIWKFLTFVDNRVTPLIPPQWNPETYLPFEIPGIGLVVAVIGLTIIGMFAAGLTGNLIMRTGERILARVPFVRSLYSWTKQIFHTVLAQKSDAFRDVVLIEYPRPESWALGFITGQTEGHIQEMTEHEVVNVFLPTTPNPTSGFLLFVPKAEVKHLTMSVEEGLKMVVSGGIVTPQPKHQAGETARPPAGQRHDDPLPPARVAE
jgi:uncharacterized membrane protein